MHDPSLVHTWASTRTRTVPVNPSGSSTLDRKRTLPSCSSTVNPPNSSDTLFFGGTFADQGSTTRAPEGCSISIRVRFGPPAGWVNE